MGRRLLRGGLLGLLGKLELLRIQAVLNRGGVASLGEIEFLSVEAVLGRGLIAVIRLWGPLCRDFKFLGVQAVLEGRGFIAVIIYRLLLGRVE